jgi:hypothetical protein
MMEKADIKHILDEMKRESTIEDIRHNALLNRANSGDLHSILLTHIDEEMKKENARREMKARLCPINLIPQLNHKLARAYHFGCTRNVDSSVAEEVYNEYLAAGLEQSLIGALSQLVLQRSAFLKFYFHPVEQRVKSRVLGAHQFWLLSSSDIEPEIPDTLVEIMPMRHVNNRTQQVYRITTAFESITVAADGSAVAEDLANPYGRLPGVYYTSDTSQLRPFPDRDLLSMALLVPTSFTDLNYASKYQAHAMLLLTDFPQDLQIDRNPDAVLMANTDMASQATPSAQVIQPSVAIDAVSANIANQLSLFLESRNVRPGSVGRSDNQLSGISKIIEEADATAVILKQQQYLEGREKEVFACLRTMHNVHASPQIDAKAVLSISFNEPKPTPDMTTLSAPVLQQLQAGLIDDDFALSQLYPSMPQEIKDRLLAAKQARQEVIGVGANTDDQDQSTSQPDGI